MTTLTETPRSTPEPESFREILRDPRARNYVFVGLAALGMVFVVLFQRGSDMGGLLLVLVGGGGLLLRWPAAPVFFLLLLTYFLIFPFGLPPADVRSFELEEGRFRIADLLLAGAVVVYVACHYRVFGLAAQAVPTEPRFPRGTEKAIRRPAASIPDGEFTRLMYLALGLVLVGQAIWFAVANVEVDVSTGFPFRLAELRSTVRASQPRELPIWLTRLVLCVGLVFFGGVVARLVLGYWRLRLMSAAEAGMMLQDEAWNEARAGTHAGGNVAGAADGGPIRPRGSGHRTEPGRGTR